MARRKKYPKLPNGYGSIKRLSGKNRTNPYGVYPPTKEFDENGNPVPVKALCYVDDWYKGFTVLTWYKHGEYYPGREKELTESGSADLNGQIANILRIYLKNFIFGNSKKNIIPEGKNVHLPSKYIKQLFKIVQVCMINHSVLSQRSNYRTR